MVLCQLMWTIREKRCWKGTYGVTSTTSALCFLQFDINVVESLMHFWDSSGQIHLALAEDWNRVSYKKNTPCGRQYPSSAMKGCNYLILLLSSVHVASPIDRWDTSRLSPRTRWCNTMIRLSSKSTLLFYWTYFPEGMHLVHQEVNLVCSPGNNCYEQPVSFPWNLSSRQFLI